MNLDKAQELFEEIAELCYNTENPKLIEILEPIQREVLNSNDLESIVSLSEEIQILMNELDFLPEEQETVVDINSKIEKLSE